jgi:hypothetical protein
VHEISEKVLIHVEALKKIYKVIEKVDIENIDKCIIEQKE